MAERHNPKQAAELAVTVMAAALADIRPALGVNCPGLVAGKDKPLFNRNQSMPFD